jgi:hypothetical protein
VAGDADRNVALGRLEVAALEHSAAHVDDVLARGEELHEGSPRGETEVVSTIVGRGAVLSIVSPPARNAACFITA